MESGSADTNGPRNLPLRIDPLPVNGRSVGRWYAEKVAFLTGAIYRLCQFSRQSEDAPTFTF
jgi:hypothetical protein